MPGIGASYSHEHPALADVRCSPITGFRKYVVFYRPVADGIEIIRVLHGARDIHGILTEEFSVEGDAGDDEDHDEP